MKFEGTQVNIPIKGIVRAGTDNLCADGAMNEVIGMEYKDGSWLPYKEKEEEWEVLEEIEEQWTNVTNIKKVYVHKVSDDSSHYVFLLQDGRVLYEERRDYRPNTIFAKYLVGNVKDLSFIGNNISVSTKSGMEFYLWKDRDYKKQSYSFPKISFKVDAGYDYNGQQFTGLVHSSDMHNTEDKEATLRTVKHLRYSGIISVLGELQNRGALTGYILCRYAYKLKNGEYINASAPILLCPPMDIEGSYEDGFRELRADNLSPIFNNNMQLYSQGANGGQGTRHAIVLTHQEVYGEISLFHAKKNGFSNIGRIENQYRVQNMYEQYEYTIKPVYVYSKEDETDFLNASFPPTLRQCVNTYSVEPDGEVLIMTFAVGNSIQYRIETESEIDLSLVDSICIFISPEISPFNILPESEMMSGESAFIVSKGANLMKMTGGYYINSYGVKRKKTQDIIDEIKDVRNFYLVKEIKLTELDSDNEWKKLDLEGKLGDNLLVLDQLPLSSVNKDVDVADSLGSYNFRLHVYDYKRKLFEGFPIDSFAYYGGFGQENMSKIDEDEYRWEIKVEIEDEYGQSSVVCYSPQSVGEIITSLSPILSYPSLYAHSMTIRFYNVNDNITWYEKIFPLSSNKNLGLSYYISPNLKPINILEQAIGDFPQQIPFFHNKNDKRSFTNGLKVSDVAYPYYFPAQYTYRIGNEKIIKLAFLTTPVSQDNFGNNQLIVFCTDGIYALTVDSSGNGAYTNVLPRVSPEVCINKNSICEIGGAILFSGDKGLMILTGGSGVDLFTPHLNGEPRFLPANTQSKEAHGIYKKMIDDSRILSKEGDNFADSISYLDFVNFIKHEETHIVYISIKNKLLAFNGSIDSEGKRNFDYSYLIDIQTRNTTKIAMSAICDDNEIIGRTFWEDHDRSYTVHTLGYLSEPMSDIPCLILSRPIKVQQDDKCSYRVVLTGYYEGILDHWACLVVLGSLDADNWRVIGVKEKKLNGGFHNLGCLTERGSWKYLMFIFAGKLSNNSHIDSIDITVDGKYNNKKR